MMNVTMKKRVMAAHCQKLSNYQTFKFKQK